MVERVIKALIVIVLAIGLVFLSFWALSAVGLAIPEIVRNVVVVIVVLLVILYLWRSFGRDVRL